MKNDHLIVDDVKSKQSPLEASVRVDAATLQDASHYAQRLGSVGGSRSTPAMTLRGIENRPFGSARLTVALILVVWSALIMASALGFREVYSAGNALAMGLATITAVVVGTVWLGAVRSLGIVFLYPFLRLKERRRGVRDPAPRGARVAILSCSANDFEESTLRRSMDQSYRGVDTIILDDSTDPHVRSRVDAFANRYGARVVRRVHRTGYKAGNLNNFFASGLEHDFYAIADSDEILPADFVELALRRFSETPSAGVVQGRHSIARGRSAFADRFGDLFETHVRVTQAARSRFGFSMFMGRGALISAACVRDAGGFPEVVAEDIAFSLQARTVGYEIVYAPEIVSCEDYPIDYSAFRKQHGKFAQASMEYIARYGVQILRSPLRAGEKVDLLLESSAAPVSVLLAVVMFVLSGVTAAVQGPPAIPVWITLALGVCGLVPLLAEFLRRLWCAGPFRAVTFLCQALALYGSTLGITISNTFHVLSGRRAVFTITPKQTGGSWRTTAMPEIFTAITLALFSLGVFGSVAPAGTFAGAAAAAAAVTMISAHSRSARSVA